LFVIPDFFVIPEENPLLALPLCLSFPNGIRFWRSLFVCHSRTESASGVASLFVIPEENPLLPWPLLLLLR
jgi:hypothetical protein